MGTVSDMSEGSRLKFRPLIDELFAQLIPPRMEACGAIVEQPADRVRDTLAAIMPLQVAKLGRIGTERVEVPGLFDLLSRPTMVDSLNDEALLTWLEFQWCSQARGEPGIVLSKVMLGARAHEIAQILADLMDLPVVTAEVLLQFGLRLIAQGLSQRVRDQGLDAEALTVLIMQQKESLLSSLDVRLVTALGYADPGAMLSGIASMSLGSPIELAHP